MITRWGFDLSIDLAIPVQSPAKLCCALAWPRCCSEAGKQHLSLQPLPISVQTCSPDSVFSAACVSTQHAAPLLHCEVCQLGWGFKGGSEKHNLRPGLGHPFKEHMETVCAFLALSYEAAVQTFPSPLPWQRAVDVNSSNWDTNQHWGKEKLHLYH